MNRLLDSRASSDAEDARREPPATSPCLEAVVSTNGVLRRVQDSLRAEVPALSVDLFRVLVGLLTLAYCLRQLSEREAYWGPRGLVPHAISREVLGFTVQPLLPSDASMAWVTVVFGTGCVLATMLASGVFPRASAALLYGLVVCAYRFNFLVMFVDDVVVHLLLFWTILLPVGTTLSLPSLWRGGRGAWERWRSATVGGAVVRLFLFNMALLYAVAGLTKWGSPLWRSGDALYAVLRLPISRVAESVDASFVPLLRPLDFATLVLEPLFAIGIAFSSHRRVRTIFVALLVTFHLGIVAVVDVPFGNLGCLAVIPLCWRSTPHLDRDRPRASRSERWCERVGLVMLALLSGAMACSALPTDWRRPALNGARPTIRHGTITGSTAEMGGPVQTALFGSLWCLGLAQQYRLLDWIDDRNFHVTTRFLVSPTDGSEPFERPTSPTLPSDTRSTLLLSYLGGVTWMAIPAADVPRVREALAVNVARRFCGTIAQEAVVTLEAHYERIDPRSPAAPQDLTLARFQCSNRVPSPHVQTSP